MKRLICCMLACILICSIGVLEISANDWTNFEEIEFTGFDHDEFFDGESAIPDQEEINWKFLTNYFSTYYFSNLTSNYGLNTKGSCGYVSIGMLLSYYDTYWDDSIIPEQYDQIAQMPYDNFYNLIYSQSAMSSPGIRRETFEMSNKDMGTDEYFQKCLQYSSSYYHLNLITRGNELGYYNWNVSTNESPCSLTFSQTVNLLNTALPSHLTDKLSVYHTTTNVRDTAIDLIQRGFPVILFVRGDRNVNGVMKRSGHAYIAYDYSVVYDTIYGHIGGTYMNAPHNSPAGVGYDMERPFEYFGLITVLPQVDFYHSCSNNYQYKVPGTNEIISHCPCELSIHPEFIASPHIHDEYLDVCEDWHTFVCETCEESGIEQPHDFIPEQGEYLNSDEHLLVCHCGYVSYGYCSYNAIARPHDNLTHRKHCLCGAYESYYHTFVAAPSSSTYSWICIGCGTTSNSSTMPTPQSLVSGDAMMQTNASGVYTLPDGTTLQILTESGSYVLSNGIIVLSPEDAALVDAGLLDPYELVENVTIPANPDHVTE